MNIRRIVRTVRYLRPAQIYYQVKYRLFGYQRIKETPYREFKPEFDISIHALDEDEKYVARFHPEALLEDRIELLHEAVQREPGKWNYPEKTHLWNFNLHYFEYGIALAVRFRQTSDKAYFHKLKELYMDWQKTALRTENQDAHHPYTISLRLKNLLIIYGILEDEEKKQWILLTGQSIYDQYRFLQKNQEKNLFGNHYFENLITLYICGDFFCEERRKSLYEKQLQSEIKEQILADGMHFERSFLYHNLILEDLLRIYMIADDSLKGFLTDILKRMTDCVEAFESERRLPHFNDAASNVAKRKDQLVLAAKKIFCYAPENVWRLEDAGYYKLSKDHFTALVDAGEVSPGYISGHSHCDTLSFELFYRDRPVLVNSGTYQYQSEKRSYFRSTAAHNTLKAAGAEQSEIWGEHRTGGRMKILHKTVSKDHIRALAKDYKGNLLQRDIIMDSSFSVLDWADAKWSSYWHIHPANQMEWIGEDRIRIRLEDGTTLRMEAQGGSLEDISGQCFYSEEIGRIEGLPSLRSSAQKICIYAEEDKGEYTNG